MTPDRIGDAVTVTGYGSGFVRVLEAVRGGAETLPAIAAASGVSIMHIPRLLRAMIARRLVVCASERDAKGHKLYTPPDRTPAALRAPVPAPDTPTWIHPIRQRLLDSLAQHQQPRGAA